MSKKTLAEFNVGDNVTAVNGRVGVISIITETPTGNIIYIRKRGAHKLHAFSPEELRK